MRAKAVFHGRGPVFDNGKAGRMDALNLAVDVLAGHGYASQWREIVDTVDGSSGDLHGILDDMPVAGTNIIYCLPSYLHGFWYFDAKGSRNDSSMAATPFRLATISAPFEKAFADALRSRFVDTGVTKFAQDTVDGFTPEPGAICLFA